MTIPISTKEVLMIFCLHMPYFQKQQNSKNDTIGEKKMESYYYIFQIAPKYALTVKNE